MWCCLSGCRGSPLHRDRLLRPSRQDQGSGTHIMSITTVPPNNPGPLRGIIPPLVTPLLGRDRLDHNGLERLIEHVLAGGVHGLFLLGTTGEGPSLSHRLRCELIERACEQVAGRVPVLVGVTDTSFAE